VNWTQPICLAYYAKRYPDRKAFSIVESEKETCCDCVQPTYDGVYFRVDPRAVKFPMKEDA
jgi:hypothetical protein